MSNFNVHPQQVSLLAQDNQSGSPHTLMDLYRTAFDLGWHVRTQEDQVALDRDLTSRVTERTVQSEKDAAREVIISWAQDYGINSEAVNVLFSSLSMRPWMTTYNVVVLTSEGETLFDFEYVDEDDVYTEQSLRDEVWSQIEVSGCTIDYTLSFGDEYSNVSVDVDASDWGKDDLCIDVTEV